MKEDYQILLNEAAVKISKAMLLLTFSVKKVPNYESNKAYLPDELEPFNALSDRFIRVVETFIKFFRTYEYYQQIVASVGYRLWLDMRDVRNKMVQSARANTINVPENHWCFLSRIDYNATKYK